jgi:hypothetical protein
MCKRNPNILVVSCKFLLSSDSYVRMLRFIGNLGWTRPWGLHILAISAKLEPLQASLVNAYPSMS